MTSDEDREAARRAAVEAAKRDLEATRDTQTDQANRAAGWGDRATWADYDNQ